MNVYDIKRYHALIRIISYHDMENQIAVTCMQPLIFDNYKIFRELIRAN